MSARLVSDRLTAAAQAFSGSASPAWIESVAWVPVRQSEDASRRLAEHLRGLAEMARQVEAIMPTRPPVVAEVVGGATLLPLIEAIEGITS